MLFTWILIELGLLYILRLFCFRAFIAFIHFIGIKAKTAVWFYSILTLPGLLMHETAHFVCAACIGFKTGAIELLPRFTKEGGVELGSVQVEAGDPVRLSFIGIAPLLFGFGFLLLISSHISLDPIESVLKMPLNWVWFYFIITISLHMFPSRKDAASWPFLIILGVVLFYLGSLIKIQFHFLSSFLEKLNPIGQALMTGLGLSIILTICLTSIFLLLLLACRLAKCTMKATLWKNH